MGEGGQCRGLLRWGADAFGRKQSPSGQTDVTTPHQSDTRAQGARPPAVFAAPLPRKRTVRVTRRYRSKPLGTLSGLGGLSLVDQPPLSDVPTCTA